MISAGPLLSPRSALEFGDPNRAAGVHARANVRQPRRV
jgi:hypothetical protein